MFRFLDQIFCSHEVIKKRRPIEGKQGVTLLYTVCILCGKESSGIETGGTIASQTGTRQEATA